MLRKVISTLVVSRTRRLSVITMIFSIVIILSLTGCLMKKLHYKSFLELREETSRNYSVQVLDSIVGVLEHAELPVFFNVEAGQSTWTPTYTLSSGDVVAEWSSTFTTDTDIVTVTSPSTSSGESVTSTLQYNDFGSAAMTRVNALYAFLCLPLHFGEITLPNGALYTIIDSAETPKDFVLSSKIAHDRYIGVTREKIFAFLQFTNDVTYWTRHDKPDAKDLQSVAGILYRFSSEYSKQKQALINAMKSKERAQASISKARQAHNDKNKEFEKLKTEAKTTSTNPQIMQTLLQYKQKEVETQAKGFSSVNEQISKAEATIKSSTAELDNLIMVLELALQEIIDEDPDVKLVSAASLTVGLNKCLERVLAGDKTVLKEGMSLPGAGGLDAGESMDKLYRERFESLPPRFDAAFQSTN